VSGDFFRTLGVPILMGRAFTSEDDRWGGGREGAKAVISYDFWQRYFSGDANVIGKTVPLERHPFTVIGVTPSWFAGLDVDHSFDVAIPIGAQALLRPDHTAADEGYHWWLLVMAVCRAAKACARQTNACARSRLRSCERPSCRNRTGRTT